MATMERLNDWFSNGVLARLASGLLAPVAGIDPSAAAPLPPLISLAGTPAEIGAAEGTACPSQIAPLLRVMGTGASLLQLPRPRRTAALVTAIPAEHHAELAAVAEASGCQVERILRANVLVDSCCSVLVAPAVSGGSAACPLRLVRNMDFFPADVIGPSTVVKRYRPVGRLAFVSIGWPGYAAVVSGMNAAGVVACVLLQHGSGIRPTGMPVCFRLRTILEHATDLESAIAAFAAPPAVASGHYALLADAHSAAVVWQGTGQVIRHDPTSGWLAASNGPRRNRLPDDPRGRWLLRQIAALGGAVPDAAWLRQVATAVGQRSTTAQSMVWEPATKTLELATGSARRPAAWETWRRYRLSDWLEGGDAPKAEDLGRPEPLPHFLG
ncbi:hypothetical protein LBMAG53_16320 [Planctomycetota bacterium]|nr:hypothetical protein LBMAG53_16320 [Planctomycetota bacterium]